jgi:hypothetical protein
MWKEVIGHYACEKFACNLSSTCGRVRYRMRMIAQSVSIQCSTIGRLLSQRLQCPFFDGDDFHPISNIGILSSLPRSPSSVA